MPTKISIPCDTCCFSCETGIDLDGLLSEYRPGSGGRRCGPGWGLTAPAGGGPGNWVREPACLRWLCRCYNEDLEVTQEVPHGGPTTNDLDLGSLVDGCLDAPGPGCYIFIIEFFGWKRLKDRLTGAGRGWISADDAYEISVQKARNLVEL